MYCRLVVSFRSHYFCYLYYLWPSYVQACVPDSPSSIYIHKIWKWVIRWKNEIFNTSKRNVYTLIYMYIWSHLVKKGGLSLASTSKNCQNDRSPEKHVPQFSYHVTFSAFGISLVWGLPCSGLVSHQGGDNNFICSTQKISSCCRF